MKLTKYKNYIVVDVEQEQIDYSNELVEYSIKYHKVRDIFKNNDKDNLGKEGEERQKSYRLTGTLGEVLFADLYGLERPKKSFGAIDGQDMGKDFKYKGKNIDVKTMRRNTKGGTLPNFKDDWVFNIASSQLNKDGKLTDYYFGISLIYDKETEKPLKAVFHGGIKADRITDEYLNKAGKELTNDSGQKIHVYKDVYNVPIGKFKITVDKY